MYKAIYHDNETGKIHLWGDGTSQITLPTGETILDEGHIIFDHVPYAYEVAKDGEYNTLDGAKCRLVKPFDKGTKSKDQLRLFYEYDVRATTRNLIDLYTDSDENADNHVLFLDIEVEKGDKYSTAENADNRVTAITMTSSKLDHYLLYILGNKNDKRVIDVRIPDTDKTVSVEMHVFEKEYDLLKMFIRDYSKVGHNIITGWNSDYFDMPYLYNRMKKVLGWKSATRLSPINKVRVFYGGMGQRIHIAGVAQLDYNQLYKTFTYTELSNYRLNTVCHHELGRGKVEYEGDLDHLFETDLQKFISYAVVDVELLLSLDEKLDFIDICTGICHKGHVSYDDYEFTSAYLDGAALTYCKRNNIVAPPARRSGDEEPAEGAFVRKPKPGLYPWVYDLDLTSLYPMNIISLNISPETKYAQIPGWDENTYVNKEDKSYAIKYFRDQNMLDTFGDLFGSTVPNDFKVTTYSELKEFFDNNNVSIASNGVIYTQDKKGLIPSILSSWFDERAEYKRLRKKYEKLGQLDKAGYYDRKQLITKILLNSFYGVLLLPTFRFYDKKNGEAVTLTGQSVINWAATVCDKYYNKELGTDKEYCIYTDTDSIFEPITPLFEHYHGPISDYTDEQIIEKSLKIINDVQAFLNKSYDIYAKKYHMIDSHRWDIKQELLARRGFWVGNMNLKTKQFEGVKKRYALWIVNEEGHPVNKLDVKGIDVVRSDFPVAFREFMSSVLNDILNDKGKDYLNLKVQEFKRKVNSIETEKIMFPTGIKNMEKYETDAVGQRKKGTPVHVKSAMNYNDYLKILKKEDVSKINSGDKILWCYVKKTPYTFKTMALKGFEDPDEIVDFVETNIDKHKQFDKVLIKKLENFWKSMNWGEVVLNENINTFFG